MGHESTAINDLIGQVARKPIQTDRNDWLFGEAPETEIDSMADPMLPVPAPQPIVSTHATHFMRRQTDWRGVMKYLALPLVLFGVVIILLGIYFAKSPSKSADPVAHVEAPRVTAAVQVVVPPPVEPTVAPANVEPANVEPANVEPANVELAAAVEPAKVEPPKPAKVEPGSPASRFLAPPPVEQTITASTVAAPKPANPAAAPIAKVAVKVAVKPAAKPARPAPKAKLARHTPARAKVAPKRAAPKVAVRDDAAKPPAAKTAIDDDAPATIGKGVLSIGSTPPLEVWVDGRNSNATTPLRVILLAGKHKVTLFDKDHGKAHTFEVEIKPNQTLKISKSYQ